MVELVERFDRHVETYRSESYNETQLRREFLDPFFEILGWDVSNTQGYAEAYKDVIHEDAIKVGGTTKAPDYGFRIGGTRKFFPRSKEALGRYQGRTPTRPISFGAMLGQPSYHLAFSPTLRNLRCTIAG